MKQTTEFRLGYDERVYGTNDDIEVVLDFIRKAGIGKKVHIVVRTEED